MITKFHQMAHGEFTYWAVPGTPHCGPASGRQKVGYSVECTFHAGALDVNGFLLDNLWFAEYFKNFQHVRISISCEKLACLIAEQIASAIGGRLCTCESIRVTLEPLPGVQVACTWDASQHQASLEAKPKVTDYPIDPSKRGNLTRLGLATPPQDLPNILTLDWPSAHAILYSAWKQAREADPTWVEPISYGDLDHVKEGLAL